MGWRSLAAILLVVASALGVSADEPREQRESPMEITLRLGRLDVIPEGAAWTSKEPAKYEVDAAVIQSVQVARKTRGDQVELELAVVMTSGWYLQDVQVDFELAGGGRVVAKARIPEATIGDYSKKLREGVRASTKVTISREQFAALFSGPEPPQLKVKLTVL